MGPIRRRLAAALALLPSAGWAEVCETARPGWDGQPVTAWGELLFLFQTPLVLVLIIATVLTLRFRSEWGGLVVVVGWSLATFIITGWGESNAFRQEAAAEGCIGNPGLFIAIAAAVCVGVVLYTAPLPRRKQD